MRSEDVHGAWAPAGARWRAWVKPVLFVDTEADAGGLPLAESSDWLGPEVVEALAPGLGPAERVRNLADTAIVVDLPGERGTFLGVALVDWGFRPIPLYNARYQPYAVVDLGPVIGVLNLGAARVAEAANEGPPAFLLDAHRGGHAGAVKPGIFDNRSVCREGDFPSVATMLGGGIRRALLIQEEATRPAPDLEPILQAWQDGGIALWRKATDDHRPAAPFRLSPRLLPVRLWHALRSAFLPRRADGTYGTFAAYPGSG